MKKLRLALDWTPNINHLGFFVAQDLGYYRDAGINLTLQDPGQDQYALTPAAKVEQGLADLAICPSESLLSYRRKSKSLSLSAIAALLQEDLSAIVVRQDRGIERPRQLAGQRYGSYGARYEDGIVQALVRKDGGQGALDLVYPDKLSLWPLVLAGEIEATWIFLNWEGQSAAAKAEPLRYFCLADYKLPYSYSPVIAGEAGFITQNRALLRRFLEATAAGYREAVSAPEHSLPLLRSRLSASDRDIDLAAALEASAAAFGLDAWGQLDPRRMQPFFDWLVAEGLESEQIDAGDLILSP